jgi:hypothetical protein
MTIKYKPHNKETVVVGFFLLVLSVGIFCPIIDTLLNIVAPPFASKLFNIFWGLTCVIVLILMNVEIRLFPKKEETK